MHFFNITAAAMDLRKGRVDEWTKAKYLIASFALQLVLRGVLRGLGFESASQGIAVYDYAGALGYLGGIGVVVVGTITAFWKNAKADGEDFVGRFIVLALPSTVRTMVVYWVVYFGLIEVVGRGGGLVFWVAFVLLATPFYYTLLFWQINYGFEQLRDEGVY